MADLQQAFLPKVLSRLGVCWEEVAHRECLSWETGVAGEKTGKHVSKARYWPAASETAEGSIKEAQEKKSKEESKSSPPPQAKVLCVTPCRA